MRKTIVVVLCTCLCVVSQPSVRAEPTDEERQIEKLTNEILRKEIELERFYLNYRVIGTREPKFRRLRYFAMQVASAATVLGSNITFIKLAADSLKTKGVTDFGEGDSERNRDDLNDRGEVPDVIDGNDSNGDGIDGESNAGQPAQVNPVNPQGTNGQPQAEDAALTEEEEESNKLVKKGLVAGMVGTIFDGGSSCIELCSNGYTAVKNIIKKQSPRAAVSEVRARVKEIDDLCAARNKIVEDNHDSKAYGIYKAESGVLKAFRDWCLSEFADVYADVKSLQSSYNVYYLFDIAADSMYVASSIIGIKALSPGKVKLGGAAINTGIVGDSLGIASVPASTVAYSVLYKFWRNRLKKRLQEELKENIEDDTKAAMKNLDKEIASGDLEALKATRTVQNRAAAYVLWSARYDRFIDKQLEDLRHQSKVALQGEITGPLISGSYLAQSITSDVAFYRKSRRATSAANLALAGSIASTCGTATSLGLTNWYLFNEMMFRRKLRKNGQLPEQLLAERLKTLDELEAMLVSSNSKRKSM